MGIDGEGYTHLTEGHLKRFPRRKARVGIEHFDGTLVAEIDLRFISHVGSDLSRQTEAGVAHLEPTGLEVWLLFVLGTNGTVQFG